MGKVHCCVTLFLFPPIQKISKKIPPLWGTCDIYSIIFSKFCLIINRCNSETDSDNFKRLSYGNPVE